MIARVGGDDEAFCAHAFGKARRDGEEDAVAEGNDGALHVLFFVVTFGDVATGFEEVALEKIIHEGEVGGLEGDACFLCLPASHGEFLGVVLRGVVDAEAGDDLMTF